MTSEAPKRVPLRRGSRPLQIALGGAALVVAAGVIYLIRDALTAFVIGALIAFLINPIVDRVQKIIPRAVAILLTLAALLALLAAVGTVFVPLLTTEVGQLQQQAPQIVEQAQRQVEQLRGRPITMLGLRVDLTAQASGLDKRAGEFLLGQFGNALSIGLAALNLLLQLLLTLIVAFLVSLDSHRMSGFTRRLVPGDYRADFDDIWPKLKAMLRSYLRGQLTVAAIIGISVGVALAFEGVQFAFALGVVAGILALVPFVGPWIGAVPIELVALSDGPGKAVVVGITYFVITNIVLQLLFPRIVGAAVKLPALMVIIAFIAGFSLAGVLGMFVAIPFAAAIAIIFDHIYPRVYGTAA